MSQQINLLNPALIKKKDIFNLNNTALLAGLFSLFMLSYYGHAKTELGTLKQQKNQSVESLSAAQSALTQLAATHAPRPQNPALQKQILELKNRLTLHQQVLKTVELSATKPDAGYAAVMKAFARQKVEGLWLTGFTIDNQSDQLNIKGNALQADLVPEYIARLGREPALQGKLFSALNMNQPKVDAAVTNQAAASQAPAAETDTKSQTSPAAASAVPSHIEFSLKSVKKSPDAATVAPEGKPTDDQVAGGEKS